MHRAMPLLLIFAHAALWPLHAAESDLNQAGKVAERRKGPAVICHRGSWEFAHENTLEAYRATFELGADGNEIDIRATRDGVLVCFHDDSLEMLLDAFGDAADYDWAELRAFAFRNPGKFGADCRIPTLEECILLHKKYGGLMQLDVKRPALEPVIAALLDKHDAWDNVISANGVNAPALLKHPKFRPLGYKASLIEERQDMNPEVIKASLAKPGEMIMVDDPRAVLSAIGRKPGTLSTSPYAPIPKVPTKAGPMAKLDHKELSTILAKDDGWQVVPKTEEEKKFKGEQILARAEAAEELRRRNVDSGFPVYRAGRRSSHPDWRFHGLDAGSALRTIAERHAPEFLPLARETLWLDDPRNEEVLNPEFKVPRSWTDFRTKFVVVAMLDRFPGPEAEKICRGYLALDDEEARRIGPPQFEGIARVLLTISQTEETAVELLKHRRGDVRGRALLICLSEWEAAWARTAVENAAPFALAFAPKSP